MRPLLLALAVVAGCQSAPPPPAASRPPAAAAGDTDAFTASLLADVAALASNDLRGRRAGSPGGAQAAAYVEGRLRAAGVEPLGGSYRQPFALPGGGEGSNVIGLVPGTVFPRSYLVVAAHYDGLGVISGRVHNGADDNASGTATLLALAERLRADPPAHSVVLAALDGEELGLVGAEAFVDQPPVPLGAILAVVNMDMVSRGDGGALWMAGTAHYPHLRPLLEPVAERAAVPVAFGHDTGAGADNWTGASDHAAFHRRGVPFVYVGVEDHPDYHRHTDDVERIDPVFFGGAARTVLDAVATLDASHAALAAAR